MIVSEAWNFSFKWEIPADVSSHFNVLNYISI